MPAPYQPFDPANGVVESFDLARLTKDLMSSDIFQKSGRIARTLARGEHITAVLTAMKRDCEMHEHAAPGPVTVTLLSGSVVFAFDGVRDELTLREGSTVVFSKDAAHRVRALDDSSFLIVIGGKTKDQKALARES